MNVPHERKATFFPSLLSAETDRVLCEGFSPFGLKFETVECPRTWRERAVELSGKLNERTYAAYKPKQMSPVTFVI